MPKPERSAQRDFGIEAPVSDRQSEPRTARAARKMGAIGRYLGVLAAFGLVYVAMAWLTPDSDHPPSGAASVASAAGAQPKQVMTMYSVGCLSQDDINKVADIASSGDRGAFKKLTSSKGCLSLFR